MARCAAMSFRPKSQNKTVHLTMEEVRGMMKAKDEVKQVAGIADQQLVAEMQRRGFDVRKPA
jgi:hypothetical protein